MERVRIPDGEYAARRQRMAQLIAREGFDVFVANSNEADFANCRYFSGYWPLFEIGGVAIAPSGQAALMIGPESETYARDRSKIANIHKLTEYRESADPAYPGVKVSNFADVFASIGVANPKRIAVAGYLVTTMPVYEGLRAAFPQAQIVNANALMTSMRGVKSEAELACLREAFRISEVATLKVLGAIKPGMTELQAVGIAQQSLYENGAEYEAHALYVL
jgi:Xaa-Pro aminopeptidase